MSTLGRFFDDDDDDDDQRRQLHGSANHDYGSINGSVGVAGRGAGDSVVGVDGATNPRLVDRDPVDGENALFCYDCSQRLCVDCQRVLQELRRRDAECNALYQISPLGLAIRRMPALLITMVLELMGGIIVALLSKTLEHFILIASFMPVISALSGNLGLQTSSNVTRGLSTGNVERSQFCATIRKEILSGLLCSIAVAIILGSTGLVWSHLSNDAAHLRDEIPNYSLIFGGVITLGTLLSMMISSTNGTLTPMGAYLVKLDPAKIAGPLETAFQDIAGQSFLLGLATLIMVPLIPTTSPPTTAASMTTFDPTSHLLS